MNDLLNLFRPGLLSDLTGMLRQSILKVPTWRLSTATLAEVKWPSGLFNGIRNQIMSPVIINAAGPNVGLINSTLAKYAAIPPAISDFVQVATPIPMPLTGPVELAKDNELYAPIMANVDSGLTDITNVFFNIIQDNISTTSTTIPINIKNVLMSYINSIDNIIAVLKIPGSLYDTNIPEVANRVAMALTPIVGISAWGTKPFPPARMPNGDLFIMSSSLPAVTDVIPAPRATPGLILAECINSISISLRAITAANSYTSYNTPKTITLLQSIPALIESFYPIVSDPTFRVYYTFQNVPIANLLPINFPEVFPDPLKTVFSSLNESNFATSMAGPTGIIQFLITYFTNIPYPLLLAVQRLAVLGVSRSFQSADQAYRLGSQLTNVIKVFIKGLNIITAAFNIRLKDDTAVVRFVTLVNDCTLKSGFSLNLVPITTGGKRKKRSRKPISRRSHGRRSTRHKKNLKHK